MEHRVTPEPCRHPLGDKRTRQGKRHPETEQHDQGLAEDVTRIFVATRTYRGHSKGDKKSNAG